MTVKEAADSVKLKCNFKKVLGWTLQLQKGLCICFLFQTTRIEFDLPEYSVRRRYQDFDWLRTKLEDSQPTHLIPVGPTSVLEHRCPTRRWTNASLTFLPPFLLCSRCRRSL